MSMIGNSYILSEEDLSKIQKGNISVVDLIYDEEVNIKNKKEEEFLEYVWENFKHLKSFLRKANKSNKRILFYIS